MEALPYDEDRGGLPIVNHPDETMEYIGSAQLSDSDTLVATMTKDYRYVEILVSNVNGSDVTFQMHRVVPGGSSSDANAFIKGATISVSRPHQFVGQLGTSWMIRGLCSVANGVTVWVDGIPR